MHIILKFLNSKWLLSKHITHFSACNPLLKISTTSNKTADVKMRRKF